MLRMKINIDLRGPKKYIIESKKKMKLALFEQVRKDSNFFIPKRYGILEGSSERFSSLKNMEIIWKTPYARRLYYNPQYKFRKDVNPNAAGLWFERARVTFGKDWEMVAKKGFSMK